MQERFLLLQSMSQKQTTSHLLMIRPVQFRYNEQTAVNNAFQQAGESNDVQEKAMNEFDNFVHLLREKGVDVLVIQDTPSPSTPDSIFPNNWISFHEPVTIVLYPMYAENRRAERKPHVLESLEKHFRITTTIDFSKKELTNQFLEGTGSMVLDRVHRIAYACLSPRTDKNLFEEWCSSMQLTPCSFYSVEEKNEEIYHTNVMMCVADRYVVICLDSIRDEAERNQVIKQIESTGKEIIDINYDQMNHFAGNMLQVENKEEKTFLVMSSQAYQSLNELQIQKL